MTPFEQIAHIADVPISVEVELDRKSMAIRQILELQAGSVVRMVNSAGENISILIGEKQIGFGEIVIIEDMMGVRITDFLAEE